MTERGMDYPIKSDNDDWLFQSGEEVVDYPIKSDNDEGWFLFSTESTTIITSIQ